MDQENFKVPVPKKRRDQEQAEAWTLNTFGVQASACSAPRRDFEILLVGGCQPEKSFFAFIIHHSAFAIFSRTSFFPCRRAPAFPILNAGGPNDMDQYTGCMLRLAIGEALGGPVGGLKEGRIRQLVGEIAGFLNPVAAFPDRLGKWRGPPSGIKVHPDATHQPKWTALSLWRGRISLASWRPPPLKQV